MMAKMRNLGFVSLLILVTTHLAYSRLIMEDSGLPRPDQSSPSFLEWNLSATTETCQPTYGFLPCSSNVWGLLFLIVVYELLLSIGEQYVSTGSELFFQIIGPGVVGASLFQLLGTIPQIVLILFSSLSGSDEAAQQRANLGIGLIAGTAAMLLTLVWGIVVVLGSYDLSEASTADDQTTNSSRGYGVVTDVETSYTARLISITLLPFLIILLTKAFHSEAAKRVVILIALIITVILLLAYASYQIFQPWIQDRRFEYLMNKYAKDKLLRLLSRNGKPDVQKIQSLFSKIDHNKNASVSATELRVLLLGVNIADENDLDTNRDIENILKSFDTSGDDLISQDEFIQGMTKLVSDLSDQTSDSIKLFRGGNNSQDKDSQSQEGLLTNSSGTGISRRPIDNSWLNYARALFFVILGTVMLCALSEPLITSVVNFSQVANFSPFSISYLVIPFAMNYGVAVNSIASARQKSKKSISLTLSAIYGGVYMNNIIGLIVFLAPVYARNLSANAFPEVLIVLIICAVMTLIASIRTTFPRWLGYLVVLLYPISLALIYLSTSAFG
ncbi:sodium/calcium exchanger NCL2-like [Andrographis paniculata]|uniref:sodium/calcium exchanger NCL2-like n=1 Tax=Andrographis paniculata TaxID=175694 RepID=UPI0021E91091|nr:sodium/calcium exchanger NCL2-like [Andrographis paniculata]